MQFLLEGEGSDPRPFLREGEEEAKRERERGGGRGPSLQRALSPHLQPGTALPAEAVDRGRGQATE